MVLALLRRFPGTGQPQSYPIVSQGKRAAYPALGADFEVIDRVLTPVFEECDNKALRSQYRYRRQQVLILLGSALVVGLGGLQAALSDQRWPGIALAVVGVVLAVSSQFVKDRGWLNAYLDERVKAEALRSQCFRYLSRTGKYADDGRETVLRRAVLAIQHGKEPE
ncbi:DUF4231 domain-containing protein [Kribbella sp. NPDC055110]